MALDITLLAVDTHAPQLLGRSIARTLDCISCRRIVTLTAEPVYPGAEWIQTRPVTVQDYNQIMIKNLWPLITTEHVLVVQYDGMAVNADCWTDDFLNYDYIGAWWPWAHHPNGYRVGNGGFSLRSRRLLDLLRDPAVQCQHNEDQTIGIVYRDYLEQRGIRYADQQTAQRFSHEHPAGHKHTFGFHGSFNVPYYLDQDAVADFVELLPSRSTEAALRMVCNLISLGHTDLAQRAIDLGTAQDPDYVTKLQQVARLT
jgi:Protein of unknown function (DUF5672)